MDFTSKKILILTDGSQGMISQVRGLAQQFSQNIIDIKTELIFPWSFLQPGFLPIFKWIFKNKIDSRNKPDLIISCGRKSVYLSLYLKKFFLNDVTTIHIQDPKIDPLNFNFVIAPNHDNIQGPNVINSIGALHQFIKEKIENDKSTISDFPTENLISFILGGKNRHYDFSQKDILNLINKIKNLKKRYPKFNILIIRSRRTDNKIINTIEKKLEKIAYICRGNDVNPYVFALKNSKFFVVTSDSTSMISECAFTGKPIYIFHLTFKRISSRIKNFHKEFESLEITKKFDDNIVLKEWQYKTLDEAKRISGILKQRIIKGFNESS